MIDDYKKGEKLKSFSPFCCVYSWWDKKSR